MFRKTQSAKSTIWLASALAGAALIYSLPVAAKPVPAPESKTTEKEAKQAPATFTAIVFEGSGNLNLKHTNRESVSLNGDNDTVEHRLEKGILYLEGNGNYEIEVSQLTKVVLKSAGNFEASNLKLKTLEVVLEGAGSATLSGTVEEQNLTVTGAGNFDCKSLKGKRATVTINGAGSAVVQVSDVLQANIGGAGNIEYVTMPAQVQENITGAGTVQQYTPPTDNK